MMRRFTPAIVIALLSACAGEPRVPETPPVAETEDTVAEAAEAPEYTERAFPDDSLHELLLAEFALRRRDLDTALNTYLEQAPLLRDAGVSAHATRLAQYLERGEDVLKMAQLWVELEPGSLEARAVLARQLVASQRNAEALPHLAAMERRGEGANFVILTAGFKTLPAEAKETLHADLERLYLEFPDSDSLLITLALISAESGDREAALAYLDTLLKLQPVHTQGLLLEAQLRAERGDNRPYRRVQQVLEENPDDQSLRLRYARMLARSDMRAARAQFEILSAQAPENADLLFSLALINREVGDPVAAGAYLRQMIDIGQRVDEARYYLGRIEQDRDRNEEALGYYQAVEKGDEYLAANSRIGEILLHSRQLKRSKAWFKSQRERYPKLSESLYALEADLLGRAGENDAAMALLNEALTATPEDSSLLYARAMLSEQRGDLEGMEKDLRDILSREPDNATALNALGYTLANRTGRYEEALYLVERALELQPGEPAIMDSMGWVLFRLQRLDEALDFLTRAYASFPDAEVAAHLGEVMWAMGDTEGALDIWRAASVRNPDHQVLKSTLQRLNIDLEPVPLQERQPE